MMQCAATTNGSATQTGRFFGSFDRSSVCPAWREILDILRGQAHCIHAMWRRIADGQVATRSKQSRVIPEWTLDELLDDELTQDLMRADHVDRGSIEGIFKALRTTRAADRVRMANDA